MDRSQFQGEGFAIKNDRLHYNGRPVELPHTVHPVYMDAEIMLENGWRVTVSPSDNERDQTKTRNQHMGRGWASVQSDNARFLTREYGANDVSLGGRDYTYEDMPDEIQKHTILNGPEGYEHQVPSLRRLNAIVTRAAARPSTPPSPGVVARDPEVTAATERLPN